MLKAEILNLNLKGPLWFVSRLESSWSFEAGVKAVPLSLWQGKAKLEVTP